MIDEFDMNIQIAKKVMGWKMRPARFGKTQDLYQCWFDDSDDEPLMTIHMFCPADSIVDAWEVVEKIQSTNEEFFTLKHANNKWSATFKIGAYYEAVDEVRADTAPLAICLAALKAVGHEIS